MQINKLKNLLGRFFYKNPNSPPHFLRTFTLSPFFIQNQKGFSLIEVIIFSGIFLIFITGTSQVFIATLKNQNLKHSQTSEENLKEFLKNVEQQACKNTFSEKSIGDDIDHIRDDKGIPLVSNSHFFKKNLKITKITSSPKITTCSDIKVLSGQNCPPGCTNPGNFPGHCSGSSSSSIPGYAELHIFFSRPGSLFETKTKEGVCNSSDQSHCYQYRCTIELVGTPIRDGERGDPIGDCRLSNCRVGADEPDPIDTLCYKAEDVSGHPAKVSLVGCGTTQDITITETTAFGFNAGSSNLTGIENTFVGYKTGENNTAGFSNVFISAYAGQNNKTGGQNTFIGYQTGQNNGDGLFNTFIGYEVARNAFSHFNTFIGYQTGQLYQGSNIPIQSVAEVFIGYQAGQKSKGKNNIFIGHQTGQENKNGDNNIFIGKKTGSQNTSGNDNIFMGNDSGQNNMGSDNIFMGNGSGEKNTSGSDNIFIGNGSGEKNTTGNDNTFIGNNTGSQNTSGSDNTFIGNNTGKKNTSGSDNIFIGNEAGSDPKYSTENNKLIIGNKNYPEWIVGDIGSPTFTIGTKQVALAPASSRTIKKNIKAFKNFDKALEDILNTPLFTFEFKKDNPQKKRIGFISEELPSHLQIKDKPSRPDITSIRGTILAAIKALYKKIRNLKEELHSQTKELKTLLLKELKESGKSLKEEFSVQVKGLRKSLEKVREELSQEIKKTEQMNSKKWKDLIEKQKKKKAFIVEELHKTKKDLNLVQGELISTKEEMKDIEKQLKLLENKATRAVK